jgi:hypothetical protein
MPWFLIKLSETETEAQSRIEQAFMLLWAFARRIDAVLYVRKPVKEDSSKVYYFSPDCVAIEGLPELIAQFSAVECTAPSASEVFPVSLLLEGAEIPFRSHS